MKAIAQRVFAAVWAPALSILLLAGCATPIDWQARVGRYTHDQAIVELGPPDKSARLTDGTTVAEWLTYRGGTSYAHFGGGYGYWHPYHRHYWGPSYIIDDYQTYESFLRLTFAPDGVLTAWKRVTK